MSKKIRGVKTISYSLGTLLLLRLLVVMGLLIGLASTAWAQTSPPAPTITTSDTLTNELGPFTIRGTSNDAETINLYKGGILTVSTVSLGADGNWEIDVILTSDDTLVHGVKNIFTVTDKFGNESAKSYSVTITVNLPVTSVAITTLSSTVISSCTIPSPSFTIEGTSTHANTISLYKGGIFADLTTSPDSDGNWNFTIPLIEGENIFTVDAINGGNFVTS